MSDTTALPRLYDIDEAARIACRTPKAMRNLRARGRGPKFRNVDGRLLVTEADLADWLASFLND